MDSLNAESIKLCRMRREKRGEIVVPKGTDC
eukprot:COSAG06_NODE_16283_length_1009_cov_0.779121_3_plen_30_part_01